MDSNYKKIFSGNIFKTQQIVAKLHEIGIEAVVKDESESARLAGFAANDLAAKEVFVHQDELTKATAAVNELIKDQK
jgi:hypothetical protein